MVYQEEKSKKQHSKEHKMKYNKWQQFGPSTDRNVFGRQLEPLLTV
jgi:hypothetical protein